MSGMAPLVGGKSGYYFLALSSECRFSWVAPIKRDMLSYAKHLECQNESNDLVQRDWLTNLHPGYFAATETEPCNVTWWLKTQGQQHNPPMFDALKSLMTGSHHRTEYFRLAIAVAGNLISMIGAKANPRWWFSIIDEVCLLQFAIGAPDIVPTHLQGRPAMVKRLLSLGYPQNHLEIPWSARSPDVWDHRGREWLNCTPLDFLILNLVSSHVLEAPFTLSPMNYALKSQYGRRDTMARIFAEVG